MFSVTKEVQFDAGHRVPFHDSKCRNPHGHRYRVVVELEGELHTQGSQAGMVLDFGYIKAALMSHVHDVYDHGFIVHDGDFEMAGFLSDSDANGWKVIQVPWHPTAENMARAIYDDLAALSDWWWHALQSVSVWETPTSCAIYRGPR